MRTGNIRVVIFILWIGGTIWMRKLKISIVFLRRWRGREWIFWKFVHFANRTSHKGVRLLSVGNLFRVRIDDNTLGATGSRGLVTLQRTLLNWHATWSFLVKNTTRPHPAPIRPINNWPFLIFSLFSKISCTDTRFHDACTYALSLFGWTHKLPRIHNDPFGFLFKASEMQKHVDLFLVDLRASCDFCDANHVSGGWSVNITNGTSDSVPTQRQWRQVIGSLLGNVWSFETRIFFAQSYECFLFMGSLGREIALSNNSYSTGGNALNGF